MWLRKILARLERNNATTFDFDLFSSLGIATHPSFPINVSKGPESDQGDLAVPFLESFLDAIKRGIKYRFCGGFRDVGIFGDFLDKFSFGQSTRTLMARGSKCGHTICRKPARSLQACAHSPRTGPAQKYMSGWWFLSSGSDYTPPPELVDFLKHRPVYIGFGSMKGNPEFCKTLSTLSDQEPAPRRSQGRAIGRLGRPDPRDPRYLDRRG